MFVLAACDQEAADDEPAVIRFVHVNAPTTPKGQGAEMFKRLAEERLPDRVRVEVYPASQLMNDDDSLEALVFGEIQMIATSLSKFDRLTKRYQVFDLPFLFPDLEAVERFQSSPTGRELLQELVDNGFLGLAYWHNGMKQFGSREPLQSPEDAVDLKFRIQESDVLQAQIQQLGGIPQKMALSEVYHALQTGAVDAQENTWSNMYSLNFYEVQPHLTASNHGYLGYLLAVNPQFWESLPDDVRTELEAIIEEVTTWVNAEAASINADYRRLIEESGRSNIIELGDEEFAAWREAMTPVWSEFEDEIGPEILNAATRASEGSRSDVAGGND
jgi:C4-dicarboxylate-binding protein DctP